MSAKPSISFGFAKKAAPASAAPAVAIRIGMCMVWRSAFVALAAAMAPRVLRVRTAFDNVYTTLSTYISLFFVCPQSPLRR
jgi:hypothetical protein